MYNMLLFFFLQVWLFPVQWKLHTFWKTTPRQDVSCSETFSLASNACIVWKNKKKPWLETMIIYWRGRGRRCHQHSHLIQEETLPASGIKLSRPTTTKQNEMNAAAKCKMGFVYVEINCGICARPLTHRRHIFLKREHNFWIEQNSKWVTSGFEQWLSGIRPMTSLVLYLLLGTKNSFHFSKQICL